MDSNYEKHYYIQLLTVTGFVLSMYAVYVEHKSNSIGANEMMFEDEFKALCDIDAIGASCSKVFALPEGKLLSYFSIVPEGHMLDIPNAALGMMYYSIIFMLETLPQGYYSTKMQLCWTVLLNCGAMSSSIFLALKLWQLKELCILCITTHVLNFLILVHYVGRLLRIESCTSSSKKVD